jgi:hypothetical protein
MKSRTNKHFQNTWFASGMSSFLTVRLTWYLGYRFGFVMAIRDPDDHWTLSECPCDWSLEWTSHHKKPFNLQVYILIGASTLLSCDSERDCPFKIESDQEMVRVQLKNRMILIGLNCWVSTWCSDQREVPPTPVSRDYGAPLCMRIEGLMYKLPEVKQL